MRQIKDIFLRRMDAGVHKRFLDVGAGGNRIINIPVMNSAEEREMLLNFFLDTPDEQGANGARNLATKKWENMDDSEKEDSIHFLISASGGVLPEYDFDNDELQHVTIYLNCADNLRLRLKINCMLMNDKGHFELYVHQNGGPLDWQLVPYHSENVLEWNDDWGGIDEDLANHTPPQREAWEEAMNATNSAFFIAETFDTTSQNREFVVGYLSSDSITHLPTRIRDQLFPNSISFQRRREKKVSCFTFGPITPGLTWSDTLVDISRQINHGEPNILLYGPPGTGKTYICQTLRKAFESQTGMFLDSDGIFWPGPIQAKTWWVTFHQSVTYEDFVLGLRPKVGEEGGMELVPRAGPLLEAMEYAKENNGKNHSVIFIDEINRGDLSRILGDFITYMDVDKRGVVINDEVAEGDKTLPLRFALLDPNNGVRNSSEKILINGEVLEAGINLTDGNYIVPPNLTIIATMNSLDRSVAPMDSAMKRRFFQINILPDADVVKKMMKDKGASEWLIFLTQHLMNGLNDWLRRVFSNDDIQIGHSYFNKVGSINDLVDAWERRILPLLLDLCRSTTKRDELERLLQWREDDTSWNNAMEYAENQGLSVLSRTRTWPYKSNQLIRSGEVASIEGGDMRLSFFYIICKQKGDDSTTWEEEFFEKYLESRHAPDEGLVGDLNADPAQFEVFNEAREGSSKSNRNVLFDVVGGGAQIVINEGTVISAEAEIIVPSLSTDRNQELVEFIRAEIGDNYEVQDGDENWSLTAPITIDLPHEGEHGVRAFGHAFFALMNYSPGSHPHRLRVRRQPDEIENNRDQTEMKRIDAFDFWN